MEALRRYPHERASAEINSTDTGPRSSDKSPCQSLLDVLGGCLLLDLRFLSNLDFRSSPFIRNFVHSQFHQVDAAAVFRFQVFNRERISNSIGVESMSLISDDNEHSLGVFAAAADMNQLASIQAIAVEYRVSDSFPKRKFNELLISANTIGSSDQTHDPVCKR